MFGDYSLLSSFFEYSFEKYCNHQYNDDQKSCNCAKNVSYRSFPFLIIIFYSGAD
jgi:hypothetical protein